MKICQIATVGENIEWILKGLLVFKANKLVLISTSNPEFITKTQEIKKRLLDPDFEINPLDIKEVIIESEDPLEFITNLKKIILENFNNGYRIEINATAGLRVWQILSYFTKIQFEDIVRKYFIINKKNGQPIIFPPNILKKTEQTILDIIGFNKKNMKDIKQHYEKNKCKRVSISLISKYLTKLNEKNLIQVSKLKKIKYFELTNLGKIYSIENQE